MALIKCMECGKEISDKATICPNCGYPIQKGEPERQTFNQSNYYAPSKGEKRKNSKLSIFALIFSVLGLTFFVGAILSVIDLCKKDGRKKTVSIIALVICGIWILLFLLIPSANESTDNEKVSSANEIDSVAENDDIQYDEEEKASEISEKIEEKNKAEEENTEETEQKTYFEYGNCSVQYLRHEIAENDMGETVLVVYYDFTNNDKRETHNFDFYVTGKAFQNGVELESSLWHANEESKNSGKDIQSGTTLTVADSYVLGDSRENVTIEFRPFNIWSDKLLMSLELELAD